MGSQSRGRILWPSWPASPIHSDAFLTPTSWRHVPSSKAASIHTEKQRCAAPLGRSKLNGGQTVSSNILDTSLRLARGLPTLRLPEWVEARNTEFDVLRILTYAKQFGGHLVEARELCEQLVTLAAGRTLREQTMAYGAAFYQEAAEGNYERARDFLVLQREGLIAGADNARGLAIWINEMASLEILMGRCEDAARRLAAGVDEIVALGSVGLLAHAAETFGEAIGARLPLLCARLYGAARSIRDENDVRGSAQTEHTESVLREARAPVSEDEWRSAYEDGQSSAVAEVLMDAATQVRVLPVGFFAPPTPAHSTHFKPPD